MLVFPWKMHRKFIKLVLSQSLTKVFYRCGVQAIDGCKEFLNDNTLAYPDCCGVFCIKDSGEKVPVSSVHGKN